MEHNSKTPLIKPFLRSSSKHSTNVLTHTVNFCSISKPYSDVDEDKISDVEKAGVKRWEAWKATGSAYAMEHATKPATIGFVLRSNPLALLAWIGEKFLDWTDEDPSIHTILEFASLYWLSGCTSTNLWSYRHVSLPVFHSF
jgi:microsomal epoxide hydrolase